MLRSSTRVESRIAFTLIELLVVVAVITILISLLLPSLKSARESARQTKCAANLRGISQAAAMYLSTSGRYVDPQRFPQQLSEGKFNVTYAAGQWNQLSGENLVGGGEESRIWDCPNNEKARLSWTRPGYTFQGWDRRYAFISYGANDWGVGEPSGRIAYGMLEYDPILGDWTGLREVSVRMADEFICFGDSNRDGIWDQVFAQDRWDWCYPAESPGGAHPKGLFFGTSVAFFDGHVAWYPSWEAYDDPQGATANTWLGRPAGIMLSDLYQSPDPRSTENEKWRVMWTRDHMPHPEVRN
jgi:prepilin-type processing-associated H-X9-DG protein